MYFIENNKNLHLVFLRICEYIIFTTIPIYNPDQYHHLQINLNIFKINLDRGATYLFPFSKCFMLILQIFNWTEPQNILAHAPIDRIIFLVFFTFNVFYWTFYLIVMPKYAQKNEEDGSEGRGWKNSFFCLEMLL